MRVFSYITKKELNLKVKKALYNDLSVESVDVTDQKVLGRPQHEWRDGHCGCRGEESLY